jgi:hypothetical protein
LEGEEQHIEIAGSTMSGIIDSAVLDFEKTTKRGLDVTDKRPFRKAIPIQGLKQNKAKGFRDNWLIMSRCSSLKF